MRRAVGLRVFSLLLLCWSTSAIATITFKDLLDESALQLTTPSEFVSVSPEMNEVLPYEQAHRLSNGELEIRYVIRPLSRVEIDYQDPHNAAPDPNHLFPLMFQTLVSELAANKNSPTREYSQDQASTEFNADWAAAATFDVVESFSSHFSQAFMLAMHKNHKADAYVIFLFDDYSAVKEEIKRNIRNLRFK